MSGLPYVWATWITGLLSGDRQCEYAAWFKAHHRGYEKLQRPSDLVKWKADHDALVRERWERWSASGAAVHLESQNKFTVKGQSAILGACPDLVAVLSDGTAVVEDAKTGKRRDSDWWQVAIYMTWLPTSHPALKGKVIGLTGGVVYRDGSVGVDAGPAERARIGEVLRRVGGPEAGAKAAPGRECAFCDIAACAYRVPDGPPAESETEDF